MLQSDESPLNNSTPHFENENQETEHNAHQFAAEYRKLDVPESNELFQYVISDVDIERLAAESGDKHFVEIVKIGEEMRKLHVFGEVFAEYGFIQRSDERFKTDIKTVSVLFI